ncbi:MAG: PhzF family phenazine biosynthesis protein [Pseudomonadales bacterium]|nr:PhzF family phenazine biosynthesis protein [Pseudomonadales bacterium]
MPYSIAIIDAFTDSAFHGNQAAICLLTDTTKSDQWMQALAAEMNLSETAFLLKQGDGWGLRWFTPTIEVNLCGHATLAAAHALWALHGETDTTITFHTLSGELTAVQTSSGIQLDFPSTPIQPSSQVTHRQHLLQALQSSEEQLSADQIFDAGEDLLVMFNSAKELEALQPQTDLLKEIPCRGLIVTAAGGRNEVDFTSRFFAPNAGIAEDPVTGSAHCALSVFWAERLGKKLMRGYQASKRGGYVQVELKNERTLLTGQAVTVLAGTLSADI